jgi:D-glycero-alpha-D-manno-heptose 1-phosphate guanylyltransferase
MTFPDVVILAGGLGKRLASVTGGGQKVLAEIGGKPFLSILIDYIASQGGTRFILCIGHGAAQVESYFARAHSELDIVLSKEEEPLGTGGAIKKGSALVNSDVFLAMNGDCFCVIDYKSLIGFHRQHKAEATIAITSVDDAREYGTIETDATCHITAFREKQPAVRSAHINTGTYCLDRRAFDLVHTPDKFSIEYDFFPQLVGRPFYAFTVGNRFIDIGTPDRYAWAQEHLKELK